MNALPHRSLLDAETLVERTHTAALIADVLRHDRSTWPLRDDTERSEQARRLAWMRWMRDVGEVNEGE